MSQNTGKNGTAGRENSGVAVPPRSRMHETDMVFDNKPTPFYIHDFAYAQEHGEVDLYRAYLMPEQRQEISDMIDEKREELRNVPFFAKNEDLLFDLTDTTDRYAIYQISDDSMGRDHSYLFMDMRFVKEHGMEVKGMDYDMVYGGVLKTEEDFEPGEAFEPMQELDQIYVKFNLERPQDFTGHSLSVSDVVMLKHDGETKAYYVDSSGFVELPDFVQERQAIAANVCRNRADAEKAKEFPPDQEVQAQNPRPMKRKR